MQHVFDLIEPSVHIEFARAYLDEVLHNEFALNQWFPEQITPDLEYRVSSGRRNDIETAEYRAFDTPPPFTSRHGQARVRGELAPLGRAMSLTEEESLRNRALMSGDNAGMIDQLYSDTEAVVRSVAAKLELVRGEILSTGKITLNENGLIGVEALFGVPAGSLVTAATVWSNPAAPIVDNYLAWIEAYVDLNGFEPGGVLMSRKVWGYHYLNTQMRDYATVTPGLTPTRLNVQDVGAVLASNGIPPITIYDTRVRLNRVATRVFPDNKITFLPPAGEPLGYTMFGLTAEALFLIERGHIEAQQGPGIVATILQNERPVQTFTASDAIALPVVADGNLIYTATVAA